MHAADGAGFDGRHFNGFDRSLFMANDFVKLCFRNQKKTDVAILMLKRKSAVISMHAPGNVNCCLSHHPYVEHFRKFNKIKIIFSSFARQPKPSRNHIRNTSVCLLTHIPTCQPLPALPYLHNENLHRIGSYLFRTGAKLDGHAYHANESYVTVSVCITLHRQSRSHTKRAHQRCARSKT